MSGQEAEESLAASEKLDAFGKPWEPSAYLLRLRERYGALRAVMDCCLNELGRTDRQEEGRGPLPMSYEVAETFFALFQDLDEALEGVRAWENREGVGIGRVRADRGC